MTVITMRMVLADGTTVNRQVRWLPRFWKSALMRLLPDTADRAGARFELVREEEE